MSVRVELMEDLGILMMGAKDCFIVSVAGGKILIKLNEEECIVPMDKAIKTILEAVKNKKYKLSHIGSTSIWEQHDVKEYE